MAEENKNTKGSGEEKNDPFRNLMNPNKKGGKGKFNFYWIYSIIAFAFIAIYFFNQGEGIKETNWGDLKQMLEEGDVEKLVLVNREFAEIYIKQDKLSKSRYSDLTKDSKSEIFGQIPQYTHTIGSVESFEDDVAKVQEGLNNPVYIQNKIRHN